MKLIRNNYIIVNKTYKLLWLSDSLGEFEDELKGSPVNGCNPKKANTSAYLKT